MDHTEFFCPNEAKEVCGKTISSDEVMEEVMKDYDFYKNSGGGMTLSGGEPLFQFKFALELLQKAKENNLHTAMETCGFAEKNKIIQIAEFTDLFLFDFKESNPESHKVYTGVDNTLILENLSLLNELKKISFSVAQSSRGIMTGVRIMRQYATLQMRSLQSKVLKLSLITHLVKASMKH